MMAGFEWTIKSAMEQAELAQHADLLTVDPAVERRLLLLGRSRKGRHVSSAGMLNEGHGRSHRVEVDLAGARVELA